MLNEMIIDSNENTHITEDSWSVPVLQARIAGFGQLRIISDN